MSIVRTLLPLYLRNNILIKAAYISLLKRKLHCRFNISIKVVQVQASHPKQSTSPHQCQTIYGVFRSTKASS